MARKENKGGLLTNQQVEEDNRVKGKTVEKKGRYIGSQDTGEDRSRQPDKNIEREENLPPGEPEE